MLNIGVYLENTNRASIASSTTHISFFSGRLTHNQTHMKAEPLSLPEVILLSPTRHEDARGFFIETWNRETLAGLGINIDFVQDNHSLSVPAGTVRGLHFQAPPFAQAKLVRVVRGSVFDVAVDIRKGSPTYGLWAGATLSANNSQQLFVPEGFAHGFITLEPDTEVLYKVNNSYSAEHDGGILWNDPALGIEWPETTSTVLSDKDKTLPLLEHFDSPFSYTETAAGVSV